MWNEKEDLGKKRTAIQWKQIFESQEFEKDYYYKGNDLGAIYTKEKTVFKVWAPTASTVILQLYATGSDQEPDAATLESIPMIREEKGIYSCIRYGNLHGIYYTYIITANGVTKETADIYAKACGVNGLRSMVIDLTRTNPMDWEKEKHIVYPLKETEIWEVHIGDFSNDYASGIRTEYRGKYLAFTEEHTTLEQDGIHPTCLSYLKQLGITHIHLLPTFDYGSIDESLQKEDFNWGYDPVNYNIPEGSYCTNAFLGEVRIKEFKEMIAALHRAGISVVMDVVYNHTHSLDSYFNRTVPYYYYRQWEDGSYSNGSDCGNDTASDRLMFRKYIIDSILYWIEEYHIDGFRFDLMGLHDVETMNQIRKAMDCCEEYGHQFILYGEPWSATDSPLPKRMKFAKKDAILELDKRILLFNDDTRDSIKGSYKKLEDKGFINGKIGLEEQIKRAILGKFSIEWMNQPDSSARVLNYVSAHDNSTLWDKLVDSVKKDGNYQTKEEQLLEMNKLAAAIVQFSGGIPFMQAGEEAGRTKQGNDNSYNSSKQLNQLDWKRMYEFEDLIKYYKGLIAVRKKLNRKYSLSSQFDRAFTFLNFLQEQSVGYITPDKKIVVIFNASQNKIEVSIEGEWEVLVNKEEADPNGVYKTKEKFQIMPFSAFVAVAGNGQIS